MGLTDTTRYRLGSQNHLIEFDLGVARNWALADVDGYGMDTGTPPADPDAPALITAFDGVTSVGPISGSVAAGGFSANLVIPRYPAEFADWFGCTIYAHGWLGGVPGIPGAGGTDAGRIVIFKGYMQTVTGGRGYGTNTTTFPVTSSAAFLRASSFSRGIDWYAGSGSHPAPVGSNALIDHLVRHHTNYADRAEVGIYLPNHVLNACSVNEGSVQAMLQSLADNYSGGEGWVMARRNDDLYIGTHPNLDRDDLHPSKNDPIIELDDGLVDQWAIPEVPPRAVASVSVVGQRHDQTEYTATYYGTGGLGSRVKRQIRTDDTAVVDYLAARLHAHLNRRYQAVKATMSGLVGLTMDLGDVIQVTTSEAQRGIVWNSKRFAVVGIDYATDTQKQALTTTVTLDEVI